MNLVEYGIDTSQLREITLADKPKIDSLLSLAPNLGCENCFTNLFVWRGIYLLKLLYIAEDRAVIYNGRDKCIYFPIGRIPSPRELLEIHRAFSENKLLLPDSRIYNVPPDYPEKFPEAQALFDFDANPGEADYIYDVEKQIALTGPKLRKKRNHIKHFAAQNPNASVEPIGESNFKSVLRFMDSEDDKKHLFAEEVAIAEAFENFRTLGLYGTVLYSDNLTIEDVIVQAGGLTEAAATTCVSVTRRIKDPKSTAYSSKLAETFTFDIKDGLLTGAGSFYLQPFDVVQVRRSPAYQVQRMVTVAGEVLFSGSYSLLKKNERLSDVIGRAGGITPAAYIKGGRLIRKRNDEERRRETDVLRMAQGGEGSDSIAVNKLAISETYAVGIDMEKALFNPGSDYDIVLREGDIVYIPEYVNTVKISGSVMYPNTVTWEKDAKLKHYINMAGGYGENAKKKKAYIIYLNGTVARAKKSDSDLIQPGCEIVVPTKSERKRLQLSEIMGMSSMTATIAAMVATLTNAFK